MKSGAAKSTQNAYIPLNGYHVRLQSSLKHLGFLWNTKKSGKACLSEKNVSERTSKFWAVVYSLIKGGVRYCNPASITDLYRTIAVPTLTYGLELCSLMILIEKVGKQSSNFLMSLNIVGTIFTNYYP